MADNKPLSERQQNILAYINDYVSENSRPPTIREIGTAVNISSTSVVNYNLTKLKEKGYLERDAEVSRGLKLTLRAKRFLGDLEMAIRGIMVPLAGSIVAGEPVMSFDDVGYDEEDMIELSSNMFPASPSDELFALRVNGESMIDAMINDGDVVILRKQETAKTGDMVAAWIEGDEYTLKYYHPEGSRIRLQPAHPHMDPIYVDSDKVQVQGKVMMVVRQTA